MDQRQIPTDRIARSLPTTNNRTIHGESRSGKVTYQGEMAAMLRRRRQLGGRAWSRVDRLFALRCRLIARHRDYRITYRELIVRCAPLEVAELHARALEQRIGGAA